MTYLMLDITLLPLGHDPKAVYNNVSTALDKSIFMCSSRQWGCFDFIEPMASI